MSTRLIVCWSVRPVLAAIMLLVLLSLWQSVDAQSDQWDELTQHIKESKQVLDDPNRSADERISAYREMMAFRQAVIENAVQPSTQNQWQLQSKRAVMKIDHALDMFIYEWNLGRSGDTVLLGWPTELQQKAAEKTAAKMYIAAVQAKQAIDDAIIKLEGDRQFASDVDMRRLRRSLAQLHRDQRAQLIWSFSAIAHAIVNQPADRQSLLQEAVLLLEELLDVLASDWADEARIYLAQALLELDRPREALEVLGLRFGQAPQREDIQYQLRGLLIEGLAQLELGELTQARASAVKAVETAKTNAESLLAADLIYRVLVAERRDPDLAYVKLRHQAFDIGHLELAEQALNRLVMKQSLAIKEQGRASMLPTALLARGLSRSQDPTSFTGARLDLEALLTRDDLTVEDHARALEILGRLALAQDRTEQGIELLLQRTQQEPRNQARLQAFSLALESALTYAASRPEDNQAQLLFRKALSLAIKDQELPQVNRWRVEAARLALVEGRNEDVLAHTASMTGQDYAVEQSYLRASAILASSGNGVLNAEQVDQVLEEALAELEQLESDQSDMSVWRRRLTLGNAERLLALGRTKEALHQVHQIEPIDSAALSFIVLGNLDLGDHAKANEAMQLLVAGDLYAAMALLEQLREMKSSAAEGQRLNARQLVEEELPLVPYQDLVETVYEVAGQDIELSEAGRRQLARLLLVAGRFDQAVLAYQELVKASPKDRDLVFGLAESLWRLSGSHLSQDQVKELTASLAYYKQISASINSPPTPSQEDLFWLGQLRTLQILDRAGRNTGQIAPRVNQLRLIDGGLGALVFEEAFVRLVNKYPPSP
ncbi:MAG: hypothetical protein P8J86_01155 [Phycisphaerales bacterium]|nr:hypothetical protein [Phycisphaerales bacterium]